MLICENLSCVRGDNVLFSGLGFCLPRSSLLLLKGPNGVGKTTLLKIIAGLLPPNTGEVKWDGKSIRRNDDFRQELMMIGHKSAVKADLTVHENIAFWARFYGTQTLLPAAMRYFGLEKMGDVPARELSAGWQRRVALARLIVAPHALWLLDEPTNFLDEEAVMLTGSLIESRVMQGGIVVAASHIVQSSFPAHTLLLTDYRMEVSAALPDRRRFSASAQPIS